MKFWAYASFVLVIYAAVAGWHTGKELPAGVAVAWPARQVSAEAVNFLIDRTYVDEAQERHSEQQIFDEVFRMIEAADEYLLADMFLYNAWQGEATEQHRALANEFTEALLQKKQAQPELSITVITDPINEAYGGDTSDHLQRLRTAGISVVVTNLLPLRDSNPLYSGLWRMGGQWFGNSVAGGSLPHPFQAGGPKVTLRTWLGLLNFKANHRKVLVADETVLVTSANPHDGSSAHSNVAIVVRDGLWPDVVQSERAVGDFSGQAVPEFQGEAIDTRGDVTAQLLTEGAIRDSIIQFTELAVAGDTIDMAMFYLAERSVVEALLAAARRGVTVRLLLDPNKDAFGHTKNGVPNRPVAHELVTGSHQAIKVRWCATHGEQCHSKFVLWEIGGRQILTAGSANLTRRNIANYNLETNVLVSADEAIPAIAVARGYFEQMWHNASGRAYTVDYVHYADPSLVKRLLYRVQEATGLSSF